MHPLLDDLKTTSLDNLRSRKALLKLYMSAATNSSTIGMYHAIGDALLVEINRRLTAAPENIR